MYEACDGFLEDDKPCKLGKLARRDRRQGNPLPKSQNFRNHDGHVCCPIGSGQNTYAFVAIVNNLEIDIYKGSKIELLGFSG